MKTIEAAVSRQAKRALARDARTGATIVARTTTVAITIAALQVSAFAQTQPPAPPVSPRPVTNYYYDAEGNQTQSVAAPGVSGYNFSTVNTYDTLDRMSTTVDPKANPPTQFSYDGLDRPTKVIDPRSLNTQINRNGFGWITSIVSPDAGTTSFTYDAGGNLKTRTDATNAVASMAYDPLNRIKSLAYARNGLAGNSYGWTYDQKGAGFANGVGHVTTMTYPKGSSVYTYDAQGHVASLTQKVGTITSVVTYGWNPTTGNLDSITYPSGRVLTLTYTTGQLITLGLEKSAGSAPVTLLNQIKYRPFGPPQSWLWQMATGTKAHILQFDLSGRMVGYPVGAYYRQLTYDPADRISAYTHLDGSSYAATPAATALNQTFGYDADSQLTSMIQNGSTWSTRYDANGNRTQVLQNGVTRTYTTPATSNKLSALNNPTRSFGYTANGETGTDSASYTATYAPGETQIASLAIGSNVTAVYSYNNLGQRISKAVTTGSSTTTTLYVYDEQGHLLGEYDNTGKALREYVWLRDTPVAVFTPALIASQPPLVYYIDADHLGTPRVVFDPNNNQKWTWIAEPFGTTAANTSPMGATPFAFNLRMPGQVYDAESGLFYNWNRYYDRSTGRYVQFDPLGLAGGSLSPYVYAEANPNAILDSTGLNTYSCTRPLKGMHDISVGPLHHAFLCTLGPTGAVDCGGLGPGNTPYAAFGSQGRLEPEIDVTPAQCKPERGPDVCFESCVKSKLHGPLPMYDVRAGYPTATPGAQQCQTFAQSVLESCARQCPAK